MSAIGTFERADQYPAHMSVDWGRTGVAARGANRRSDPDRTSTASGGFLEYEFCAIVSIVSVADLGAS